MFGLNYKKESKFLSGRNGQFYIKRRTSKQTGTDMRPCEENIDVTIDSTG